ncbi:uncharacterized protein LAJ45_09652 [Morchella importuna]|uniref:uncharacterized protein n=1 Tax=Morchella importuna TaxID=1174673 RepID=UPI001E8DB225|nr:uncharacterized protein LAJ45_09652 [Morchella importuna]KAH8146211.1 hypothetical protein LAJ45_09652 [Morchella importuna]
MLADPSISPIILFIDAVDECLDEDKDAIITLLDDIADIPGVKLCISSRIHPGGRNPDLILDRENTDDIAGWVRQEMKKLQRKYEYDEDEMYPITEAIISNSEGIFSWAVLIVRKIQIGARNRDEIEDLRKIIDETPTTMTDLIPRIFENISKSSEAHLEESRRIFRFLYFTERALSISEFRDGVNSDIPPPSGGRTVPLSEKATIQADGRFEQRLIARSGGLLERGVGSNLVLVIHYCVNDFLMPKGFGVLGVDLAGSPDLYTAQSHDYLASLCISYLTREGMEEQVSLIEKDIPPESESEVERKNYTPEDWKWKYPFLNYATSYWLYHAREAQNLGIDQTHNLASFDEKYFNLWIRIDNLQGCYQSDRWIPGTSKFHIAVENNLLDYVKGLDLTEMIDTPGGRHGNALSAAVLLGHQEMLEYLLEKGANTEVRYRFTNETPLYLAVSSWNESLVKALLKGGANPNAQCDENYTPLHLTSINGDEQMGRLLLDGGAIIDKTCDGLDTPLHFASRHGNKEFVQMLIEKQADINLTNAKGDTPLHDACYNGYSDIVGILLSNKANCNIVNLDGNTPLHCACISTYDEPDPEYVKDQVRADATSVIRTLLTHPNSLGINPTLKNGSGKTPLELADEISAIYIYSSGNS